VVAFESKATDLAGAPGSGREEVYLYRVATSALERVSVAPGGEAPDGNSATAFPSAGGRFVAFASFATNLVAGDGNSAQDIFVRDTQAGVTTRVSVTSASGEANYGSYWPSITADGCVVAFISDATNLAVNATTAGRRAYVRDRCAGVTELASVKTNDTAGTALAERPPAISDDGCLVGMTSGDMVDAGGWRAAVIRNRCTGTTLRADLSTDGAGGNGHTNGVSFSPGAARYVVFHSGATNLAAGDPDSLSDVYLRDRATTAPPVAALQVTRTGRRVLADTSASSDPDGEIASTRIDFGDGTTIDGVVATHEYAGAGTYTITATVTDADGLTDVARQTVTVPPDDTPGGGEPPPSGKPRALKLTKAKLSRSRFAAVPRGKRPKGRQGATLTITTSAASKLTLRYEREQPGRRSGKRCSPKGKRGARCIVRKAVGTVTATLRAGVNRIRLTGRVGARALKPGRHRLTLTARTSDGRRSAPVRLTITITKGR
jgi:hypothetical protein